MLTYIHEIERMGKAAGDVVQARGGCGSWGTCLEMGVPSWLSMFLGTAGAKMPTIDFVGVNKKKGGKCGSTE
jgi:hypothetical protein